MVNALTAALADCSPSVWQRLLDEHLPGPDGRCRSCPGTVVGRPRWPCRLHALAAAARVEAHRRLDDDPAARPARTRSGGARSGARPPIPRAPATGAMEGQVSATRRRERGGL